ncbi:MAG: nucleoside kinase [Clostridia bacterium]|nr:nucleoside kinase [Clostridia bacterium]
MELILNGQAVQFEKGETFQSIVKRALPDKKVLGVLVGGETLSLTEAPRGGEKVRALDMMSTEGRLIYERSLRFVFLLAVHQLFPNRSVRIEHSLGTGLYCVIRDNRNLLTAADVKAIEARMWDIVRQDLKFEKHPITKRDAIAYFERNGEMDKVNLLRYRPYESFQLYRVGDMMEYFYGIMAPSTGLIDVFALHLELPGVVLLLPDNDDPTRVATLRELPRLMNTFAEAARWNSILHCSNTADLNGMINNGQIREFIRVNEAMHERAIMRIAEQFQSSGTRVILIAGPSSSGKTTFANRLAIDLRVLGLRPVALSLDDYYIDREKIPYEDDGSQDLERLDTLDVPLFNDHLVRLLQGEPVAVPLYDFKTQKRSEKTHLMHVEADQPIIIEGIHGLNNELTRDVARNLKFKIYISALTNLNLDDHNRIRTTDARLLRRMVRDYNFRKTMPEETMAMWASVRRGEEKYIFPYQEEADVVFNSSLVYEIAVLKKYVYPMLQQIAVDSPYYTMAHRLTKFLNYFCSADVEDEIPINSIIREFIGGSCFYRENEKN